MYFLNVFINIHLEIQHPYLTKFSMKFSTLLETFIFLSSNGDVNAIMNKNIIDTTAQIAFNGNSKINVKIVVVSVTIHATTKSIGFIVLFFC